MVSLFVIVVVVVVVVAGGRYSSHPTKSRESESTNEHNLLRVIVRDVFSSTVLFQENVRVCRLSSSASSEVMSNGPIRCPVSLTLTDALPVT